MDLKNVGLKGVVPNGIESLTNLKKLILDDNDVTGVPDFASNALLEELDISYNLLKTYAGSFPTSITNLKMNNNTIELDISTLISKLDTSTLVHLDMSKNKLTGTLSNANFLSAGPLTTLKLAYNKLSGDLPSNIRSGAWETFDVSNNFITGSVPESLKTLDESKANIKCNMFSCTG